MADRPHAGENRSDGPRPRAGQAQALNGALSSDQLGGHDLLRFPVIWVTANRL